jgi:DNA modification methylase
MTQTNLYKYDAWQLIESMPDKSVDCIITDPLYDCELNLKELQRVCRGNIVVFCSPENQFFKPDEFAFWVKTPSTKNYSKHVGRFVEMILVMRGGAFNCLHWSQMTGVYDDRHINKPSHPFEKPLSLMERLVRIYSNPEDLVFDPFMGSGSTIKACQNLQRHAIGCERDEKTFESTSQSVSKNVNAPNKACTGLAGTVRLFEHFSGFEFLPAPEHSLVPPANQ